MGPVRLILFRLILISSTPVSSNLVSSNNLLLVEFFPFSFVCSNIYGTMVSQVEFIRIKRGARCLVHDGFKYTLNRRGCDGQCYWRCADRMCPGREITSENDELLSTKEHNHEGIILQDLKNIKNVKGCRDGMSKSMQTR